MLDFSNQVAIVTGGASGMGAATARALAALGATVFILDRNAGPARRLADEIHAPAPLIGDVSDSRFCEQATAQAIGHSERLDVLINCAGIIVRADAPGTSDAQWAEIMNVNVNGVFYMSRAAVRQMRLQGKGAIVNFGSIWGGVGASGVVAYCATKGAVHQLTRAMALDHVDEGIRINAVCPGEVNTPMLASGRERAPDAAELQKLAAETVPMGRLAEPEEIARVAVFLASDAASYMTGSLVAVDAGYTAR